ncbi:hypothetical protein JCGZ_17369 [Jatropha curcas]|uniref:peroxidase n=1 Tax=Jatropha curcas TaxID=180498 RepID=A0A067LBL3_JATCU|nr:hypothetical protein JCGZ_17369 [Jatropha curcas]
MVGGPFYTVQLGRKDGLISKAADAEQHVPRRFTETELVALMGAHTIGFSHCKEFAERLYNYSNTTPTDPDFNPKYAAALKTLCANYTIDTTMSAFNDVLTPSKFDNMYFQNLPRGLGLLSSDHILVKDPRTKPAVDLYAKNQTQFFVDFARAMEKLSVLQIKTGDKGEVRHRCDHFNSIDT